MKKEESLKPMVRAATAAVFRLIEGRVLTDIETLNLPEKQESAIKSIIRNDIWDVWENEMAFVPPEIVKMLSRVQMTGMEIEKLRQE